MNTYRVFVLSFSCACLSVVYLCTVHTLCFVLWFPLHLKCITFEFLVDTISFYFRSGLCGMYAVFHSFTAFRILLPFGYIANLLILNFLHMIVQSPCCWTAVFYFWFILLFFFKFEGNKTWVNAAGCGFQDKTGVTALLATRIRRTKGNNVPYISNKHLWFCFHSIKSQSHTFTSVQQFWHIYSRY